MTDIALICHPTSDAGGVDGVVVSIARAANGEIHLVYRLSGDVSLLDIAAPGYSSRVDGLWKTTCFECFITRSNDEDYLEYNFASSGQWAAYQFASYREGMTNAEANAPEIKTEQTGATLNVSVVVRMPEGWLDADLLMSISTILATKSGDISYWAAAHPPGKADFHHKDCFAVQLEARSAA
jgi:hypothetical protein